MFSKAYVKFQDICDDIQEMLMCGYEFLTFIITILKIFMLFIFRSKTVSVVDDLKSSNSRWADAGMKVEHISFMYTRNMYILIFVATFVYTIFPIVIYFLFTDHDDANNTQWPLPIAVHYGINFSHYPLIYVLVLIVLIPQCWIFINACYGIEIFFINLLLRKDMKCFLTKDVDIVKRILNIVVIHNKGIAISKKIEEILNLLMLVLYVVNTFILGFLFLEFHVVPT
ncbi:CLUMA_CG017660, isoform A [Clunio marinus]|uniref:CLUMA_CG017660, isoform A n=1 Tax=Clunio marinus TaxID=568069 RepID=A0A1J1IWW2_9DIPT|nr:CLUMA_CG017660, isoform A [Clunio marinus]